MQLQMYRCDAIANANVNVGVSANVIANVPLHITGSYTNIMCLLHVGIMCFDNPCLNYQCLYNVFK